MDEAGLAALSQVGQLRSLILGGAGRLTERGVLFLTRLSALRALSLRPTTMGDMALAQIARMPHLPEYLDLGLHNVTDRG